MALEDLLGPDVFWGALVRTNPEGSDPKSEGDDHIRGVKNVALNTNPRVNAAQNWSAAESNQIIPAINNLIADFGVGQIGQWPLAPPLGWIVCDGQAVSRATYPLLFAYLGVAYGDGDGATTFNVPDYRGEFARMQDQGAGNDPNAAARTDRGDGTTGDAPGTQQLDEFKAHFHTVFPAGAASAGYQIAGPMPQQTGNTSTEGGSETRPRNVYQIWAIRHDALQDVITPEDDPA